MFELVRVGGLLFGTNTDVTLMRDDSPPRLLREMGVEIDANGRPVEKIDRVKNRFDVIDSKLFFMLANVEATDAL